MTADTTDWSQYIRGADKAAPTVSAGDEWEQFRRKAAPEAKPSNYSGLLGGGFASGYTGAPVDIFQTITGAPVTAKKLTSKVGISGPLTPEQQKYAETIQSIPGGSEYLYQHGEYPEPQSGLQRYAKTISQRAGGGAAAGTLGGIPGMGIGAVAGGAFGAVEQTMREMGVPEEYIGPALLAVGLGVGSKAMKAGKPNVAEITEGLTGKVGGGGGGGGPPSQMVYPPTGGPIGAEVPRPPRIGAGEPAIGRPLQGRVSTEAPQGTPRIISQATHEVGPNVISNQAWLGDAEGGHALNQFMRNRLHNWRTQNTQNYNRARAVAGNYEVNPQQSAALARDILGRLEETTSSPSAAELEIRRRLNDVVAMVGTPEAAIATRADRLMGTANSIANSIKYEEPYVGAREQLKDVVRTLNEEAIAAVEKQKGNANAIREADRHYAEGARQLFNDDVAPFIEERVSTPEKLRELSKKPGTYRSLNEALDEVPGGQQVMDIVTRDVVEERMKPFVDKPETVGSREYTKAINDLGALIGEERTAAVDQYMTNRRGMTPTERGLQRAPGRIEASRDISSAAKYLGEEPKTIESLLNNKHGIRELTKRLDKTENGTRIKEKLYKERIQEIVRGGKVEPELTGEKLYDILNNETNYEMLTELVGKGAAETARLQAKSIGKKTITKEFAKKMLSKSLEWKAIGFVLGI